MAKAKVSAMDPLSMIGGLPSFSGGPAGPSMASGTLSNGAYFGNSFAVGSGASATASNSGGSTAAGAGTDQLMQLVPWLIIGVGLIALAGALRK